LLGGVLVYRLEDAAEVLTTWRALAADAPDNLACFALVTRSALTAEQGAVVSVAYFGDPDEGYEAIQPLMEGPAPVMDTLRPMYYAELQEIFGRMPFGLRNYWTGRFVHDLPDELVELTANRFRSSDTYGTVLIEPLYGAAKRVPPEATAFSGRAADYNVTYINSWLDASADEQKIEIARDFASVLAPWATGGGYLNYASESVGDGLEAEYGAERLTRLRAVKGRYDPENRFRFNHNISPA
jgi:FAD/FMN-containing dehydrogenase